MCELVQNYFNDDLSFLMGGSLVSPAYLYYVYYRLAKSSVSCVSKLANSNKIVYTLSERLLRYAL